jgi:hypothetical protein
MHTWALGYELGALTTGSYGPYTLGQDNGLNYAATVDDDGSDDDCRDVRSMQVYSTDVHTHYYCLPFLYIDSTVWIPETQSQKKVKTQN